MASSFIVFIPVDGIDELSQDLHSFGKVVLGCANVILPVVQDSDLFTIFAPTLAKAAPFWSG